MKIYVWGTGCGAGELVDRVLPAETIAAFVETVPHAASFLGRPVIRPDQLRDSDCDLILVTLRDTECVLRSCEKAGVETGKLFFLKNHMALVDRNQRYGEAEAVLGKAYVDSLRQTERRIRRPLWSVREVLDKETLNGDYVRVKTLELLCREITAVPGAIAELGVYRGSFARCMHTLLPERTLYLFDTFEGFEARESAGEGKGFVEAHRRTGPERVLNSLPHPERAVIRQGLFPETASGLEERFALVSLDVDLEESTLAGLHWFLPRLNPGGYLMLHDYISPQLSGVRAALQLYEVESGARVHAVPLCDINGTLVISA